MEAATPRAYVGLWVRQALSRTWNVGDTLSGIVGAAAAVIAHYSPAMGREVTSSLWEVPIYALAGTALFRFMFFAPYELWAVERGKRLELAQQVAALGEERPFLHFHTELRFELDANGQLSRNLSGLALHHRNIGERPIRYALEDVRIRIDDGPWQAVDMSRPTGLVQGETQGWHRGHLPMPVSVPEPAIVRVNFDYRYDTIPSVVERRTGATLRFVLGLQNSMDGPFNEDQREE